MKIGLRGGHSPNCKGAIGILDEQAEVRKIYYELAPMLQAAGHTVVNCNSDANTVNGELNEGTNKANSNRCDVYITIHMNASGGSGNGTECWMYDSSNGTMNAIADRINANFASRGFQNRGKKFSDGLHDLNASSMPAMIVETLFCDNQHDADLYRKFGAKGVAQLIASGITGKKDIPTTGKKNMPVDGYVKENAGVLQDTKTEHLGETNYNVHARGIGWLPTVCDGMLAGSEGENRRIEALRLDAKGNADVSVHMRGIGDKTYKNVTKDTVCGTINEKRRIESIKIVGKDCFYMYRVHQHKNGWTGWKNNGEWAGEKGKSLQIEAIEIKKSMFSVNAHVQTKGWLGEVASENVIGTTGKSKRLEAIKINPYGKEIKAKAHIQGIGWVDYGTVTKDTVIGTVGEGKRLEDLCFKGDFFFRVHLQDSGWTPWTKADGVATLGTVGQGIRIEAIQFK